MIDLRSFASERGLLDRGAKAIAANLIILTSLWGGQHYRYLAPSSGGIKEALQPRAMKNKRVY